MNVHTAVITAAGLGTRLHPASAVIPKVMFPLLDKPAIQFVVEEALEAGMERLVMVVGFGEDLIRRHFDEVEGPWAGKLHWVRQEEQRGLGHAVLCAAEAVGQDPFALLFGDSVFLGASPTTQLLAREVPSVGVHRVAPAEVTKRGVLVPRDPGAAVLTLHRWFEKPAVGEVDSDLAVMGRSVFSASIFAHLERALADATGEVQLAAGVNPLLDAGERIGIEILKARRLDVGNPLDYAKAFMAIAKVRFPDID